MQITSVDFIKESTSQAQCMLTFDDGVVSLKCISLLPDDADDSQHRIAWLQDALRQLRRMPEYRAATTANTFGDIALSAATAMERNAAAG